MLGTHIRVDLPGFGGRLEAYHHYGCAIGNDAVIFRDYGIAPGLQGGDEKFPGIVLMFFDEKTGDRYPLAGVELNGFDAEGSIILKTYCFDDIQDWTSHFGGLYTFPKGISTKPVDFSEHAWKTLDVALPHANLSSAMGMDCLYIQAQYIMDNKRCYRDVVCVGWHNGVLTMYATNDGGGMLERKCVYRGIEEPD